MKFEQPPSDLNRISPEPVRRQFDDIHRAGKRLDGIMSDIAVIDPLADSATLSDVISKINAIIAVIAAEE